MLALTSGTAFASDQDMLFGTVVVSVPPAPEACIDLFVSAIGFRDQLGTDGAAFTPADGANNVVSSNDLDGSIITNCSTAASALTGRVTQATGTSATWNPYDPIAAPGGPTENICVHGLDLFRLSSIVTDTTPPSGTFLIATDRPINGADTNDPVPAGGTRTMQHELTMPCVGSSGADGETVRFTMLYTAALAS